MTLPPPATGARPEGTMSESDAAANVQQMFDTIAPTYDRANHLLSFGLDRFWWRRAARALHPLLQDPGARVLDLCCGTGDMTAALLTIVLPRQNLSSEATFPPRCSLEPV